MKKKRNEEKGTKKKEEKPRKINKEEPKRGRPPEVVRFGSLKRRWRPQIVDPRDSPRDSPQNSTRVPHSPFSRAQEQWSESHLQTSKSQTQPKGETKGDSQG